MRRIEEELNEIGWPCNPLQKHNSKMQIFEG